MTITLKVVAPVVVMISMASHANAQPSPDVLGDIEGNSRGITRQEVEAALVDWCASPVDAPLCVKLRVAPPPGRSRHPPAPNPYYFGYGGPGERGYYRPGRFQTGMAVSRDGPSRTASVNLTEAIN